MTAHDLRELESLFLALGDKTRLKLLGLMADGPVAVGLLAEKLGESQPKVSRHLAYLRNAGVVSTERDGKYIYYGIETPDDARVSTVLDAVIASLADERPTRKERRHVARAVERQEELADLAPDAYTEVDDVEEAEAYDSPEPESRDELDVFLL